jgi:predicted naringenin-chalcone synthase
MSAYIQHIATEVPENYYTQEYIRDFMKKHVGGDRLTDTILHRIYTQSHIEKRHSVLREFQDNGAEGVFVDKVTGALSSPSTGTRNALYTKEARKLFVAGAQKVFEERADLDPSDITHIITVSCTGFYAPGPDLDIISALKLPANTQRYHIGFMGCYAGLTALRMAKTICDSDKNAHVLVVSTELCTLHLKFNKDTDSLLSTAVFADGCAAAYVSGKVPDSSHNALRLDSLTSTITPNGAEDMAWTIGDNGFDMTLSTYIPDIIESNLEQVLQPIWEQNETAPSEIDIWAIHPGGRAIVDKVSKNLNLSDKQIEPSRATLRDYGNMSSATILFVLKHVLEKSTEENAILTKTVAAVTSATLGATSDIDNHVSGSPVATKASDAELDSEIDTDGFAATSASKSSLSSSLVIEESAVLPNAKLISKSRSSAESDSAKLGPDSDSFFEVHQKPQPQRVLAMAFGPGLTVETGLLTLI